MPDTNRSDPEQNPWYPWHVSDRADELLDELVPERVEPLHNALRTKSFGEWMCWFEIARASICRYDLLSPAERKRLMQNRHDTEPLLLHHACIFLELWRARLEMQYYTVRHNEFLLENQHAQREMMLSVLASYYQAPNKDYWPFDDYLPFRSDP